MKERPPSNQFALIVYSCNSARVLYFSTLIRLCTHLFIRSKLPDQVLCLLVIGSHWCAIVQGVLVHSFSSIFDSSEMYFEIMCCLSIQPFPIVGIPYGTNFQWSEFLCF